MDDKHLYLLILGKGLNAHLFLATQNPFIVVHIAR